jgi:hypothetical protein
MDEFRKCVNCAKFISMRKKTKRNGFRYASCIVRCDRTPQIKNFEEKFLENKSREDRGQKSH